MDPNALLSRLLGLANRILAREDTAPEDTHPDHGQDAADLAQGVLDLNTWLCKGGFKPTAWSKTPRSGGTLAPNPARVCKECGGICISMKT